MLKYEIDKEGFDALDDAQKAFYDEKDGKYLLKVDGLPQQEDVSGLKKKIEELMGETKAEREKRKKQEEEARKAAEEAAKKSGDIEALEKSWNDKLTTATKEKDTEIETLNKTIYNLTVKSTATKLAAELAVQGSADVLLPHIERRLTVETKEGKTNVRIMDAEGKPTAMTVDDLKNELRSAPAFAPIISGSKASGSGYNGGNGGKGKKFNELTGAELSKIHKENPQEYERLKAEFYG